MTKHGRIDLDAAIPRMRFAPEDDEDTVAYMARVAAATAFAYKMPDAQFARQPRFRYEVDSLALPVGTISRGRVHGRVRLVRDAALVAATGVDHLFVYLIVSGSVSRRPDRSAGALGPGDIFVHDLAEPAEILLDGYELLLLVIGRSALPEELRRRALNGAVVSRDHPLATLVMGLIAGIHDGAARLRPAHANIAFEAALTLLGAALAEVTVAGRAPVPVRAVAETIIDAALCERELTPALVAGRLGVSRATLYRAFQGYGGVGKVIAHRRLHRAWTLLSAKPAPSVATVAKACGYASAGKLDQALHAAFGLGGGAIASLPEREGKALAGGAARIMADNWRRITHER